MEYNEGWSCLDQGRMHDDVTAGIEAEQADPAADVGVTYADHIATY